MKFVNPNFLWFLLALAIPIIVHLFNFQKYKKVVFTQVSILKSIVVNTRKTSQLKKLLLLASRLLALLFLILAFAQPFWDKYKESREKIVSIYIDNSSSMNLPSENKLGIDIAKSQAKNIVNAYDKSAKYIIFSNNLLKTGTQVISKNEALTKIEDIKPSPHSLNIEKIVKKQHRALKSIANADLIQYWFSDFQKHQFSSIDGETKGLNLIPITYTNTDNIYIDTCVIKRYSSKPQSPKTIHVTSKKNSENKTEKSLITILLNGKPYQKKEIFWGNKSVSIDTIQISSARDKWQDIEVKISDPHIQYDNSYFATLFTSPKPYVTLLSGNSNTSYIKYALTADQNFDVHQFAAISTIPPEELKNTKLLILNQWFNSTERDIKLLNDISKSNINLLILPPQMTSINTSYNEFLEKMGLSRVVKIIENKATIKNYNADDALLSGIFQTRDNNDNFPSMNSFNVLESNSLLAKNTLISFDNQYPFLERYSSYGQGEIYLVSTSIDINNSNFATSSLFAPILYKIGNASGQNFISSYVISPNSSFSIPISSDKKDNIFTLYRNDKALIPPQGFNGNTLTCHINDAIEESGIYILDNSKRTLGHHIALNFERKESVMNFYSENDLKSMYSDAIVTPASKFNISKSKIQISNTNTWKWLLAIALFFLILEMIIWKYWDKIIARNHSLSK